MSSRNILATEPQTVELRFLYTTFRSEYGWRPPDRLHTLTVLHRHVSVFCLI